MSDAGPETRRGTDRQRGEQYRFGAPLQLAGAWAVAGALVGAVVGLLFGELDWGALIGFAVGAVVGTLRDSRRIFRR